LHNWWMLILQTIFSSLLTLIVLLGYDTLK
jgi:hypothetical protein